jgi:hypothetical protein
MTLSEHYRNGTVAKIERLAIFESRNDGALRFVEVLCQGLEPVNERLGLLPTIVCQTQRLMERERLGRQ